MYKQGHYNNQSFPLHMVYMYEEENICIYSYIM